LQFCGLAGADLPAARSATIFSNFASKFHREERLKAPWSGLAFVAKPIVDFAKWSRLPMCRRPPFGGTKMRMRTR
jgi:hypothetical protein